MPSCSVQISWACDMELSTAQERLGRVAAHLGGAGTSQPCAVRGSTLSAEQHGGKVSSAERAVSLVPDGATLTVSARLPSVWKLLHCELRSDQGREQELTALHTIPGRWLPQARARFLSRLTRKFTLTLTPSVPCSISCPVALADALRARFDTSQQPQGLHLLFGVSCGDYERGVCRHAGYVGRMASAWTGASHRKVLVRRLQALCRRPDSVYNLCRPGNAPDAARFRGPRARVEPAAGHRCAAGWVRGQQRTPAAGLTPHARSVPALPRACRAAAGRAVPHRPEHLRGPPSPGARPPRPVHGGSSTD